MFKRVLTYDLKYAKTEDYQELYDYLKGVNATKLTESSYLIETKLEWDDFKKKILSVTKTGDNVKAIVNSNGIEIRTIR
ncbi:MAG: hypothetical protein ACI4R8_03510 [Candidatus Caccovivens sp.]